MKARRDVYQAIADPTRRAIINIIAAQPHNIKSIAEKFDISQQAISLHVKILTDCGLITIKQRGRDRFCEAQLDQLSEVAAWVDRYRQHWESKKSSTQDRELIISRMLNAPVELVWEAWTKPEHIAKWWGPNGFTNTIDTMDVRPGGEFNLVMHGPDGTDYKNKSIFKEIIPYKKIVFEHISSPGFVATIDFEEQGDQTFIRWHMLFETAEQFIQVVKTFKADEGLKQNVEKLNVYLAGMKGSIVIEDFLGD